MTREEEAIIEMQRMKKAYCNTHTDAQLKKDSKIIDALDIGIKALDQEPCEDCISRQAVLNFIRSLTRWCVRSEDGKFNNVGLLYDDVMFGIDRLPTVKPQEKIGHWIRGHHGFGCSNCHKSIEGEWNDNIDGMIGTLFCPNCGARMQKVEENG